MTPTFMLLLASVTAASSCAVLLHLCPRAAKKPAHQRAVLAPLFSKEVEFHCSRILSGTADLKSSNKTMPNGGIQVAARPAFKRWVLSLNFRAEQSRLICNDLFGVADVRIRPHASQIFRQPAEARQKRTKLQDKDNLRHFHR